MAATSPLKINTGRRELFVEKSHHSDRAAFIRLENTAGFGPVVATHLSARDVRELVDYLTPFLPEPALETFKGLPIGAKFYIVEESGNRRDDKVRVKVSDSRYFVDHITGPSTPSAAPVLYPEGMTLEVIA